MGSHEQLATENQPEVLSTEFAQKTIAFSDYEVWSISHEEQSIEVREKLAALQIVELCKHSIHQKIVDEIAIVSTCNRFEIYAFGIRFPEQLAVTISELSGITGIPWKKYFGQDAIEHVFKVASGMSSMVLGETQIFGQIKDSYDRFVQAKTVNKYLHSLFQFAFKVAKRVRDKTSISREGVSIGSIAVRLAQEVLGELSTKKILLIGSGEQAEITLMHLKAAGAHDVVIANRTLTKAAELAERFQGSATGLFEIERVLSTIDLVIGSISIDRPIVEAQLLRKVAKRTRVFIDLGVPRNFSASIVEVGDSYLYSIDDLAVIAKQGNKQREESAQDAETVIAYGVIKFREWFKKVLLQTTIISLREKIVLLVSTATDDQELINSISEKISHEVLAIVKAASSNEVASSDETYSDALLPVFIERFYRA